MSGEPFPRITGPLRSAYAAVDWAATSLGPIETWGASLRNALDLALNTRFPVTLLWGPEFILVYNSAYVRLIAGKHPRALGRPAREVFPEAWDAIGPLMEGVLAGHGATWMEEAPVPLDRDGALREASFTFSYSPVRGDDGHVAGVMNITVETTSQVIARRRLALLSRLGEDLGDLRHPDELAARIAPVLDDDPDDLPAYDLRLDGVPTPGCDLRLPAAPVTWLSRGGIRLERHEAGRIAWLPIGPQLGDDPPPAIVVLLSDYLAPDDVYVRFLGLLASSVAHALGRVTARESERRLSEALQRSLLATPQEAAPFQIAVRYRPAAEQAQIGGDWYDAFVVYDGSLTLVIGDVTGHDREATAAMAQVRNLLRGVAFTLGKPPGLILAGLDQAMEGLAVDTYATAVVAQVKDNGVGGAKQLHWSNAGHPPPVVISADGSARLLDTPANPLLGLGMSERADHAIALEPGTTVVFYTDGLVERRGRSIQTGLDWLREDLRGRQGATAEAICDHLVSQLDAKVEDDVALLVLRLEA